MNKIFYLCNKFQSKKNIRPLLFFHVPKSAGTTFSVIFSWLFNKQTRIKGPLFKNNDKAGKTAFELFNECPSYDFYNKFNFIYGHLPFEINNLLKKSFLKISLIRDPIKRTLSHYNWMINRGYCSKSDDLQRLFDDNRITKNTITNQFSGKGYQNKNLDKSLDLAYENLSKNIDYLYKSNDILSLIKKIISEYDLPNIIFQNHQESNYKKKFSELIDMDIIIENNKMDIELFETLSKNNIFQAPDKNKKIYKNLYDNDFFFSSPNIKINGKNSRFLDKKEFDETINNLHKNKFKIISA